MPIFDVVLSNDSMKPAKLKIHQNTKHPSTVEKEDIHFVEKKNTYLSTNQMTLHNIVSQQEGVLKKSCRLSFEVALVGSKTFCLTLLRRSISNLHVSLSCLNCVQTS